MMYHVFILISWLLIQYPNCIALDERRNVEQFVESELARETEVLGENTQNFHLTHDRFHINRHSTELGSPR